MTYTHPNTTGLPDPDEFPLLYDRVPARRLVAWLFDLGITFAATMAIIVLTLGLAVFVIPLVWLAVSFFYRTFMLGAGSATVGMRLVGIELRDRDGRRFDYVQAALHTFLYSVFISSVVLQFVSAVLMLGTRYGQGLPDVIMGSTAINTP